MKQLFHAEDRHLLISMVALSLVALLAAVLLSLAMAAYTNQALKDTYAGIVGTVVQRYPQAEAQVVQDLRAPEADSVSLGTEVLEKYGLGDPELPRIPALPPGLLARLLPVGLALVGLVCTGFVLLLVRYQRAVSAQVAGLSAYLRRIDAGDYALDVRDNGEGSFSLLKNDLYKVTVRLREQAELLQKDKTALSNLIADISHQIKTPLTSLGVLADLLAEDPPEADRRAFVERLRAQLGRIQWLVAALLKLARLDAGTAAFKSEPVDVRRLIERALEPLQIPLEIKRQRLVSPRRRRGKLYRRPQLERRGADQRGQELRRAYPGGWEDRDPLRRQCPVRRDHRQRRWRGDREPGFTEHLQPLLSRAERRREQRRHRVGPGQSHLQRPGRRYLRPQPARRGHEL